MAEDSALLGTNLRLPAAAASRGAAARDASRDVPVHLLPCAIEYSGPARVGDYFKVRHVGGDPRDMEATLRGRLLRGARQPLPDGVAGVVIQQSNPPRAAAADQQNYAAVRGTFDHITYWNHDTRPSARDYLPDALKWFEMARCVHAPLAPPEDSKAIAASSAP